MNKFVTSLLGLALLAVVNPAWAAQPERLPNAAVCPVSPGAVQATPDMWYYGQAMKMYMDPQMMVRMRAEAKAEARDRRLEAMRWFGYSNSRPRACSDPIDSNYSPFWGSNTWGYPSMWSGYGPSWMIAPGERIYTFPR